MYVGLIFSVPGVTFDLDSFGFEVLICGSSAKHNVAPKKAKRQQSSRFYFHEADRIWISIFRQHFFVSLTNNLDS